MTSDPRDVVAQALDDVLPEAVRTDDEGDQSFEYDGVPGFIQHGRLGTTLALITISCLAGAYPRTPALDRWAVDRSAEMLLGAVAVLDREDGTADVLIRYCLPAAGLDPQSLRAVLLPVIAAGAQARRELASWAGAG